MTGAGNDTIYGEAGNDILKSVNKNGSNVLDGGDGTDICIAGNKRVTAEYKNCEVTR